MKPPAASPWAGMVLCLVVGGLFTAGCAPQRTAAVDPVEQARGLIARGETSVALRVLRDHLQQVPDDVEAGFLAGSLLARSDPQAAIEYLARVPEESPDYPAALRLLAAASLQINAVDAAEKSLRRLQSLHPEDAAVQLALSDVAIRRADYEAALIHARRAAALQPDQASPLILIAEILDELGRVPESVEPLSRAVQLDPNSIVARANLGYALYHSGDLESAGRHLDWCLQRDPRNARLLLLKAEVARDAGQIEEARSLLTRALTEEPAQIEGRALLAEILLYENRPAEALQCLEAIPAEHRTGPHLLALLWRAAVLSGERARAAGYQKALAELRAASRTQTEGAGPAGTQP